MSSESDSSTVQNNHTIIEPMMAMNPLESEMNANYYTNYWLENNQNHDTRVPMGMENHQTPPTYHHQHQPHHQSAMIEPPHYEYPAYNYMGYNCVPEDANRFNEEDEVKLIANRNVNRPLTTSHHVQQLSHLCPPFSEQDNNCSTANIDMNNTKNKLNNRKLLSY